MRSVIRYVYEKWPRRVLLNKLNRTLRYQVSHISFEFYPAIILEQVRFAANGSMLVIINPAVLETEELIKPVSIRAVIRFPTQMPLSCKAGSVAMI